ncbi:MAG: glycoside hydrolase [Actinobacteria bacterium]|nr:glycoside hydrolase [Actinomycetota bacterium]
MKKVVAVFVASLFITSAAGVGSASASTVVGSTVNVTNDVWANNEESLGMDPTGTLLAGAWNDWEHNDGCGFSYSTDGGATWAPESFVRGITLYTNDPDVPGTGRFAVGGDPSVIYNPKFSTFDIVCQAFGTKSGNQVQMLATTFDPDEADPTADVNDNYGADAWTTPVVVPAATTNGGFKGSNGKFPDHESVFVDTLDAPGHHYGRLFVTWAQFSGAGKSPIELSYSDDNGATWSGPEREKPRKELRGRCAVDRRRIDVEPNIPCGSPARRVERDSEQRLSRIYRRVVYR